MRGEEIWPLLDKNISAMVGKSAYLIRGVADANIEVGKIRLDNITEHDFQPFLLWLPLNSLCYFRRHPWIQLYSNNLFCFL